MIELPLCCTRQDKCAFNCSSRVYATSRNVDVVFILDKEVKSTELLRKIANGTGQPYAILYTMRYIGKRTTDCLSALYEDLRILKPKVLAFVGHNGYKFFNTPTLSEYEWRGTWGTSNRTTPHPVKEEINGVKYDTFYLLHPSAIDSDPSIAGIFQQDVERILTKELRELQIVEGNTKLINSYSEIKDYLNYLTHDTESRTVGFDIETLNLNKKFNNKIVTLQFSDDGKTGYVIPWQHSESALALDEQQKIKNLFIKLFSEQTKFSAFICHNGIFEATQIFAQFGVMIRQTILDTYAGAWLLEENRLALGSSFSLEALFREFRFDKYAGLDSDVKAHRSTGSFDKLALSKLAPYGARDAYGTYQLFYLQKRLAEQYDYYKQWILQLKYYYSEVYKMFALMGYNGTKADIDQLRFLKSVDSPIKSRMKEIEKEFLTLPSVKKVNTQLLKNNKLGGMKSLFGGPPSLFDLNSVESKRALFFDSLALKPVDFGKPDRTTGNIYCPHDLRTQPDKKTQICKKCGAVAHGKLDKAFQTEYEGVKEVAIFVEYSQMKKLLTSYVNQLFGYIDPEHGNEDCQDQRLRPDQNPCGTVTSRASTRNPNSAQIPKSGKSQAKTAIKNLYIAEPGKVLIQFDYATAEVRGLGILSEDKKLAALYNHAEELKQEFIKNPTPELKKKAELFADIHKQTANTIFGVPIEKVEKEVRDAAKGVTFGLVYGMGIPTLAGNLGKSKEETKKLVDKFFDQFAEARDWIKEQHEFARKYGYVQDPLGVRRHLGAFLTDQEWAHAQALRQAVNSQIQGACARFAMLGAALASRHILENGLHREDSWGLLSENYVHDSIQFSVKPEYCAKAIKLIKPFLTTEVQKYCTKHFNIQFNLPLDVDVEIGVKLGELHKLDFTKESYQKAMKELGFR